MIRVMSFNLRTASIDDGAYAWAQRRTRVAQTIRNYRPDLLGLQECRDDAQAAYLHAQLPGYVWHGRPRGGEGDSALEMAPLLWRESAFELLASAHFALSQTPERIGGKGWDADFARTASWAQLRERRSGRELLVLNTHFDYQPQALLGSAQLLHEFLRAQALPLIVCGDFNAPPDSAVQQTLLAESLLRDVQAGAPRAPSYHGYGLAQDAAAIDWILVSPQFQVTEARLLQPRPYASDHDPLLAILDWR